MSDAESGQRLEGDADAPVTTSAAHDADPRSADTAERTDPGGTTPDLAQPNGATSPPGSVASAGDGAAVGPPFAPSDDALAAPNADFLSETLGQGGPVLLVLALLSIAALAILLIKLWQFWRLQLNASEPTARALRHWYRYAPAQALAALEGSPQPTAKLLQRAITALAVPGVDVALLREEMTRFATAQLEQLRAWLRALEVIAALSPLLGLLGTVLGMIEAFRQLELAGSQVNPAVLSGGIWQALLTTAAGLGVAIPVVLLHSWLERRVERCSHRMEDALTRVFTRDLTAVDRPVASAHTDHQRTPAAASAAAPSRSAPAAPSASASTAQRSADHAV